jgi:hypothetical protein
MRRSHRPLASSWVRGSPWAKVTLFALLTPLLAAATDPSGDVGRCPRVPGVVGDDAPDLIEATGEIVERGTSARFSLRFAEPLVVPDERGRPFRIDIVLVDPAVPRVDAGLYRGVNRLLRYDAVAQPITTILLLPEAGQSRFIAPAVEGRTLVLQVPGRTLSADEDETGVSPGLARLRWGVIVRDERACDLLGDGRPTYRLLQEMRAPDQAVAAEDPAASWAWLRITLATLAPAAFVLYLLGRRTRNAR